MNIRPLEKKDIDQVIKLWANAFSSNYDKEKCLTNVSDPNSITLIAEKNNTIIGVASLYIIQKLTRKLGLIEDVAVNKNYRGNGTGKLLVENLVQLSFKNNCDKIMLNASEQNIPFYEKMGFERKEVQMIIRKK
mgnify:CR=1 FL=1|jgi:ribosomal protein S18 acetylase RimI-like enzyme|tara:strand:+ start:5468 stop:5869 length:402 start_codon:yes stop_codon:yes gene_type:complete